MAAVLNFNHLYYFHVTAVEGSIKAAADRLGVTQPTVSEQLRMLERSLGVSLFERTSSGLRMTEDGRRAFEHTAAMFLASERLASALGQNASSPPVNLRVGISSAVSRTIAAEFLMPVLTIEQCEPSIHTGEFTDLLRALRAQEIDLMIGETEPIEPARPNLELVLLHRPGLVAIAHPDVVPSKDWHQLSLLEYRTSSAYHWEVDNYLRDKGLCPKVGGELDDAFLMLEAVARGNFVAFVPASVARPAVKAGRVKTLASFQPSSAGVYALFPSTETASLARAAVERLIENAREQFDLDR